MAAGRTGDAVSDRWNRVHYKPPPGDDYMTPELRMLLALHNSKKNADSAAALYERIIDIYPPGYLERMEERSRQRRKDAIYRGAALRRARMLGAPNVEKIDRSAIFERDKGVCHICSATVDPEKYHLDHVIPLVLGGDHTASNLKVAHPRCNLQKGAKLLASVAA